ncbi:MAG: ATP-dependent 6-phosphofructokinase [Anaerolineaceae bacterium]|nr:ATP-dependent 6-phosphofructokinase [Anaerolineaceae bacterium]
MARNKKLGILTGGGDVPGLNPAMKAVVETAIDSGWDVIGVRRGWGGLLHCNTESPQARKNLFVNLTKTAVRTIDRTGGTFLHTSRTNPQRVRASDVPDFLEGTGRLVETEEGVEVFDFTPHILNVLEFLEIDALIPIGGDDTLSYAARLHQEGFPVVAIPKTMDNDVYGTDYCIGFSTAVTRSVEFITSLRTPSGSHERIAIVELFGRNSGETSLIAAYLADVDRAIISEVPFDVRKLSLLLVQDKYNNPSNYAIMTISEGAHEVGGDLVHYAGDEDAYGHKKLGGIGAVLGEKLKELTNENIIYQQLGYLMRSGAPDSLDRMVAVSYGLLAMDLVAQGRSGRMVALRDGVYTHVPLSRVVSGVKRVDVDEMYDREQYRPKIADMLGKPMFLY